MLRSSAVLPWYVSSETLAAWADSYVAAARLPELLRRLILLSTQVERVHFPGGKQVYSSGFDGEVVSASGSAFVPKGHSCVGAVDAAGCAEEGA